MIEFVWKWTRLTSGPIVATGIASLITFAATTLLLRTLPLDDAGLFAISMALVETLSLVGALGQATLITRLYASAASDGYDWLRDLLRLIALSVPPVALGIVVSSQIYPFSFKPLAFVALAAILTVPVNLSAYMLNAHGHHAWGALILRLPNSLLLIPALLATTAAAFNNLDLVLSAYVIGIALTLAFTILQLYRHLPRGEKRISLRQHLEGTIFLLSAGSQLMLNQGIVAIAGAMLEPAALAAYAAVAILLRPFRLVANILSMVFSPRLIQQDRESFTGPVVALAGLGAIAAAAYLMLGQPIADLIFGSRYQSAYPLIPWLSLVGFLIVIRILPISHMAGRAPVNYINRVISIEAGMVAVSALITVYAIAQMGILGLAIGLALGHAVRAGTTFVLWRRFRQIDPARGQPVVR